MLKHLSYSVGRGLRETGQALERVGMREREVYTFQYFLNRKPHYKLGLGKNPDVNRAAFIAPNAAISGDVRIQPDASIWYGVVLRGDTNYITIGNGSSIGDNTVVHVSSDKGLREMPNPTSIGDNCVVEPGCVIHACTLQDNCTVGAGSVVMDGSVVGENSVLLPGSFLSTDSQIPDQQVWGGKPARYQRTLSDAEVKENQGLASELQKKNSHIHKMRQQQAEVQEGDYDEKTFYHTAKE